MARRHVTRTIEFPNTGICSVAVVSDTHGKPHPNLFPLLEARRPSLILHAGDVGGLFLIKELEKISPTTYVRGNVDPTGPAWADSVALSLRLGSSSLDVLILHVAVAGLKLNRAALDLLNRYPAQVVVFGHSHIPFLGVDERVSLFNPGSAGPPRWRLPTTIGLIEIASDRSTFKHIDLHTGGEWKPERGTSINI
jgi:putative phosphoesterase